MDDREFTLAVYDLEQKAPTFGESPVLTDWGKNGLTETTTAA